MRLVGVGATALAGLGVTSAFWEKPHMTVVEIARRRLKPEVAQRVDDMLQAFSGFDDEVRLVPTAVWPDLLKSHSFGLYTHWHYSNTPVLIPEMPPMPDDWVPPPLPPEDVVWMLGQCETVFRSDQAGVYERAVSLRLLLHMIGDLHQPLHAVEGYSPQFPDGDWGGNKFELVDSVDSHVHNLHAFWDSGCGLFIENDFRYEELITDSGMAYIQGKADEVVAAHPWDTFLVDSIQSLDYATWLNESVALCEDVVYVGIAPEDLISSEYRSRAQVHISERIALGGYRMAYLLNQLVMATPPVEHDLNNGYWNTVVSLGVILAFNVLFLLLLGLWVRVLRKRLRSHDQSHLLSEDYQGVDMGRRHGDDPDL